MKRDRKKDIASFQNLFCFTGEELRQYHLQNLPNEKRSKIFYHLNIERCQECRSLYRAIGKPAKILQDKKPITLPPITPFINKRIREAIKPQINIDPKGLEKGQIWTTLPEVSNRMGKIVETVPLGVPILITWPGNGQKELKNPIRVIPISFDIDYQFKNESLVLDKTSPVGFPILLEIFNERPMLAGNLGQYRGTISEMDLRRIKSLRARYLKEEATKGDKDYQLWKQKEIKLTEYLSFPVNEGLWEEPILEPRRMDLRRIINLRELFLKEEAIGVYQGYQPLEQKEIKPTGYPSFPVNKGFGEDETISREKTLPQKIYAFQGAIELTYYEAAETEVIEFEKIKTFPLKETKEASIWIIQKWDKVLLRFASESQKLKKVTINSEIRTIRKIAPGLCEIEIGLVNIIPEQVEIAIYFDR